MCDETTTVPDDRDLAPWLPDGERLRDYRVYAWFGDDTANVMVEGLIGEIHLLERVGSDEPEVIFALAAGSFVRVRLSDLRAATETVDDLRAVGDHVLLQPPLT